MRTYRIRAAYILAALLVAPLFARPAAAQGAQKSQKPSYTIAEYNQFTSCQAEKNAATKVKCLDSFVAAFPKSTLLQYVYEIYYQTYYQLKNYSKSIEYADKLTALGNKAGLDRRLSASQARVQLFPYAFNPKAPDAQSQLTKERDAALQGAKLLEQYKNASGSKLTGAQYKSGLALFYSSAGFADLQLKDNAAAIQAYKTALMNKPNDGVSEYRLGLAYLATTPPASLDGFWALARAIDLKVPDSGKVKNYLRRAMLVYEQPGCDNQVDGQMSQLLQLAANAAVRPASFTIPSSADLQKIRQSSNILTVISSLSMGGDTAKTTWLAVCGAQFSAVVGKVIQMQKSSNSVDFMIFTGATKQAMEAATMPNIAFKVWTTTPPATAGAAAAKVTPQPDVVRLQKGDGIRFSGTVVSYDASPFLLHWDQVMIDPSIIPKKAAAPAKRTRRRR